MWELPTSFHFKFDLIKFAQIKLIILILLLISIELTIENDNSHKKYLI